MKTPCLVSSHPPIPFCIWLVCAIWVMVPNARAVILVDDDLTPGEHVWDDTTQPYRVVNSITVMDGARLTVRPGVVIELNPMVDIRIEGSVTAHGDRNSSITITGTLKVAGSWNRIEVSGESGAINDRCSFRYVEFEYGGCDLIGTGYLGGMLAGRYAEIRAEHCVFRHSGVSGAYAGEIASYVMNDCHFENNAGYAVLCYLTAIPANYGDRNRDSTFQRLTAKGNQTGDSVAIAEAFPVLIERLILEKTGLPYHFLNRFSLEEGGELIIESGVKCVFHEDADLYAAGPLMCLGTPEEPVVLTGLTANPGSWDGVTIEGAMAFDWGYPPTITWTPNEGSRLTHTVIEYGGGSQANLVLSHAKVSLTQCEIRHSARYGVVHEDSDGSVIERSRIEGNVQGGVFKRSSDEGSLLAAYNWWGDASGPYHATENPAGAGDAILNDAAEFMPFLTTPDQTTDPNAPTEVYSLTVLPGRWFIPANGLASITSVTVTVRDGAGRPVPGRQMRLDATLGTVIDGGITDINGQTTLYIYGTQTGDATLTPRFDVAGVYTSRAESAEVTFIAPDTAVDLFPNAEAPYVNRDIEMAPLPLMIGVPVVLTVHVENRSSVALELEANFVKHNYGIGLPLEVIDTVTTTIPAQKRIPLQARWTPIAPGHQCIGLTGSFAPVNNHAARRTLALRQKGAFELPWLQNTNPHTPSLNDLYEKQTAGRVQEAVDLFSGITDNMSMIFDGAGWLGGLVGGQMLSSMLSMIISEWEQAIDALRLDPPRQDFRKYATVERFTFPPISPTPEISARRAGAINAMLAAHLETLGTLRAARLSLERFSGACLAEDQTWAGQQCMTFIHYLELLGDTMRASARRMNEFLDVLRDEGVTDIRFTQASFEALQERLRTTGFNAEEQEAATWLRLNGEELDVFRQRILSVDAEEASRRSVMQQMESVADEMMTWSAMLDAVNVFGTLRPRAKDDPTSSSDLARVYLRETQFPVGNPLDHIAHPPARSAFGLDGERASPADDAGSRGGNHGHGADWRRHGGAAGHPAACGHRGMGRGDAAGRRGHRYRRSQTGSGPDFASAGSDRVAGFGSRERRRQRRRAAEPGRPDPVLDAQPVTAAWSGALADNT